MPRPSTYPVFERPSGWNALLPPRVPKTSAALKTDYEYAVIGAGYTGLAVARRLAELNPSDRGNGDRGGNLRPQFRLRPDGAPHRCRE
jgi:hypothetical protein